MDNASFSRRGDALLSGSRDGTARLWRWRGRLREPRSTSLRPPHGAYAAAAATVAGAKPPVVWVDMVCWPAAR